MLPNPTTDEHDDDLPTDDLDERLRLRYRRLLLLERLRHLRPRPRPGRHLPFVGGRRILADVDRLRTRADARGTGGPAPA